MIQRFSGMDVGAPPDVVADFLIDSGFAEAAILVRKVFGKR